MNRGHENQPTYDKFSTFDVNVDSGAVATLLSHTAISGPTLTYIKAKEGNTGNIAIGKSDVTALTGYKLAPGELSPPLVAEHGAIYLIAAVDNEDVEIIVQH